ncbi:hypothetical protein ACIP93_28210 [Streptomyces sp. NPDC088745]|uniref:hypothetical protein n=1 Tax=Streptomyces sp. NPDC088745 TaxID=3365884 RepID=UPI003807F336
MNDDINRRLREAAEAHQPDRAKILARVERGASGPAVRHRAPAIARSWPKAALTGFAAAGILATGTLAVAGIVQTSPPPGAPTAPAAPPPSPTTVSPTPAPTPTPPPPSPPRDSTATAPPVTHPPTGSHPTSPPPSSAAPRTQSGPLSSNGTVDSHSTRYWAQSNLLLTTTRPLTSLTVELRIALTGGVRDTGNWRTLPSDDFTVTVRQSGGGLLYRWALKPGRTVPAWQHTFAAQYNHAPGTRDASADSYRVDARSSDGPVSVRGGFAPAP